MKTDKITERDKQDFWIQKHQDEVDKLMKKETSMLNEGSITQDQYDKQLYKRLETNKLIVYQKKTYEFSKMSAGSTMNPQTIKNEDVSEKNMLQCHNNLIVFQV